MMLKCPKCNSQLIFEQHIWYSNSHTKPHTEFKLYCVRLCGFSTRYYRTLKNAVSCFKRTDWSRNK
jgi:hypothetical protein